MKTKYILWGLILGGLAACEPYTEEDISLGPLPEAPAFSVEILAESPNRVVVRDESDGFFDRLWNFQGGQPNLSKKAVDTVFFPRAGEYDITLYASKSGGNGTSSASKKVVILQDAVQPCSEELKLLAGGCGPADGKCWTLTRERGAVTVGPTPGSGEWFVSNKDGLQAEQYDDSFCFYFTDNSFRYLNNGLTIDPWKGYAPVPYDPPTDYAYTLVPGGGPNGELRIILPEGAFMGVWDASNVYDVVVLTEDELVVRTPFLNGGGWFEMYFVAR